MQGQKEIDHLKLELSESNQLHQAAANEFELLKAEHRVLLADKVCRHELVTLSEEVNTLRDKLFAEEKLRKSAETELHKLKKIVPESNDDFEVS